MKQFLRSEIRSRLQSCSTLLKLLRQFKNKYKSWAQKSKPFNLSLIEQLWMGNLKVFFLHILYIANPDLHQRPYKTSQFEVLWS